MKAVVRGLVVSIWSLAIGWAAPPLTTIQDVLYKADGTPFQGILVVEWKSFDAADTSNIATQSLTTRILNGVLRVQLVPTTNAATVASYSVKYSSDGRVQFQETWGVPPSSTPLRVRDVRIAGSLGSGTLPPSGDTTAVQEADVVGLLAALAMRPARGPGSGESSSTSRNSICPTTSWFLTWRRGGVRGCPSCPTRWRSPSSPTGCARCSRAPRRSSIVAPSFRSTRVSGSRTSGWWIR